MLHGCLFLLVVSPSNIKTMCVLFEHFLSPYNQKITVCPNSPSVVSFSVWRLVCMYFLCSDCNVLMCVPAVSRAACRAVMRRSPHATWAPTPARTGTPRRDTVDFTCHCDCQCVLHVRLPLMRYCVMLLSTFPHVQQGSVVGQLTSLWSLICIILLR